MLCENQAQTFRKTLTKREVTISTFLEIETNEVPKAGGKNTGTCDGKKVVVFETESFPLLPDTVATLTQYINSKKLSETYSE